MIPPESTGTFANLQSRVTIKMAKATPQQRGILDTMGRGNRIWEVPGKSHCALYNDKTDRDRVLSRKMVVDLESAGWIRRTTDSSPQRLESWEITDVGRAVYSATTPR